MQESTALLHTIPDTLKRLQLGRTIVYDLVNKKELELVKIGRRSMITESSILDFVERLRSTAASRKSLADDAAAHARSSKRGAA